MPYVVKKYGNKCCLLFLLRYIDSLVPQRSQSCLHKIHGPQTMLKPAVIGPRIYKTRQPELPDVPQALEPRMFNNVIDEIARDADKSINRIIDDLPFIC